MELRAVEPGPSVAPRRRRARPASANAPSALAVPSEAQPLIADEAPTFEATTLDGAHVSLKALRGHPVVLSFFMTECSLCWEEVPTPERLRQAHAGDGTVFLAITREPAARARAAFNHHPLSFPIIADPEYRISSRFPVDGWPTNVVLDEQGRYFRQTVVHHDAEGIEAALRFVNSNPPVAVLRPAVRTDGACRLSGIVLNRRGGTPEANANLIFWGQPPPQGTLASLIFRATTDVTGHFEIENVACGPYTASVHRDGLTDQWMTVMASAHGHSRIEVAGLGVVEGVVRDASGAPFPNATVSLCDDQYGDSTTQTDAEGRFTLTGLQAMKLAVRVRAHDQVIGVVQSVEVNAAQPVTTSWVLGSVVVRGKVRAPSPGMHARISTADVPCTAGTSNGRSDAELRANDVPVSPEGSFEVTVAGNTAYAITLVDEAGNSLTTRRVQTPPVGSVTAHFEAQSN